MEDFLLGRRPRRLGGARRGGLRRLRRDRLGGGRAALNAHRDGLTVQRHVLFLRRIEVTEKLRRDLVFALVRAQHRFESLFAADPDVVVLFEVGRGRILVPAAFVFKGGRRDAVEISTTGDGRGDREGIADLGALRFYVRGEGKIPDR